MTQHQDAVRPITIFCVLITGILAGGLLGGVTNSLNGNICPDYFVTNLGWQEVRDVGRAAIAQGIFEGLMYGTGLSVVLAVGLAIITKAACNFGFAIRKLVGIMAGALVGWALGGGIAMALASLSPEFYRHAFRGVPDDFSQMLRYAWVGGSIWGLVAGGVLSLVVALAISPASWRRHHAV